MIGIPLGLMYANATEWFVHKNVLHGAGRKRTSFWSFHWLEHHRACQLNEFSDADYEKSLIGWNAQTKEALTLGLTTLAHLPLFPVAPFFTGTVVYCAWNYYRSHKRSHLDPEWAREHLSWHYDHHMAPDQDANWCVTKPWFDHVMGTRVPYVGTERDRQDRERAARRAERKAKANEAKANEAKANEATAGRAAA